MFFLLLLYIVYNDRSSRIPSLVKHKSTCIHPHAIEDAHSVESILWLWPASGIHMNFDICELDRGSMGQVREVRDVAVNVSRSSRSESIFHNYIQDLVSWASCPFKPAWCQRKLSSIEVVLLRRLFTLPVPKFRPMPSVNHSYNKFQITNTNLWKQSLWRSMVIASGLRLCTHSRIGSLLPLKLLIPLESSWSACAACRVWHLTLFTLSVKSRRGISVSAWSTL